VDGATVGCGVVDDAEGDSVDDGDVEGDGVDDADVEGVDEGDVEGDRDGVGAGDVVGAGDLVGDGVVGTPVRLGADGDGAGGELVGGVPEVC
jgi:hypothetical protein